MRSLQIRVTEKVQRRLTTGLIVVTALLLGTGFCMAPYVYRGAPAGVDSSIEAGCIPARKECLIRTALISPGRYAAKWTEPGSGSLRISPSAGSHPRYLVIRAESPGIRASITRVRAGTPQIISLKQMDLETKRMILPLDTEGEAAGEIDHIRIDLSNSVTGTAAIGLPEIGLYESDAALERGFRPVWRKMGHSAFSMRLRLWVFILTLIGGVLCLVPRRRAALYPALFFSAAAFSFAVSELYIFQPPREADVPLTVAAAVLETPGSNLNYGIIMGKRLLSGQGLTINDTYPPWERMPGYGLLAAAISVITFDRSLMGIALHVVVFQVLLFATAVGLAVRALWGLVGRLGIVTGAMIILFAPRQLVYTQVDSLIVSLALLSIAAGAWYLKKQRGHGLTASAVPLGVHFALHGTFALWLLMRSDGLIGWGLVSLLLYGRNIRDWKYFLIPVASLLILAASWGGFKYGYTHQFSPMTNSVGASAFAGLWDIPNKSEWEASDGAYFKWILRASGLPGMDAEANRFATKQVLRFYVTYPGYTIVLFLHKFWAVVSEQAWAGLYSAGPYFLLPRGAGLWAFICAVTLSLVLRYKPRRTLILGWAFFFNLPIFCLVFASGGRYIAGAMACLVFAGSALMFERGLYRRIRARAIPASIVLGVFLVLALAAGRIDKWLVGAESFRYHPILSTEGLTISPDKGGTPRLPDASSPARN